MKHWQRPGVMLVITNIYIDAEYLYAVAQREDMLPNYKMLIDNLKTTYPDSVINAYFIGDKNKKCTVMDFLHRIGVNFVHIIQLNMCSKTQVMGSVLAWDVCIATGNPHVDTFVFVSGDDYLVPIIYALSEDSYNTVVYYFPLIFSRGLEKAGCKLNILSNSNLIFSDKENTNGNAGSYQRQTSKA
jgi:hypothetical protein